MDGSILWAFLSENWKNGCASSIAHALLSKKCLEGEQSFHMCGTLGRDREEELVTSGEPSKGEDLGSIIVADSKP